MELLAIYVEDYKCFRDYTIPFSPDYDITLKKVSEKKFSYNAKAKTKRINIFKEDFGRVTCFIGENGSGKSTIAKMLRLIASNKPTSKIIIIIYLNENDELVARNYLGDNLYPRNIIEIIRENKSQLNIDDSQINKKGNLLSEHQTKLIFFSNLFSYSNEKLLDNKKDDSLINISIDYALRKELTYDIIKKKVDSITENNIIEKKYLDITKEYYIKKLKRIINFLIYLNKKDQLEIKQIINEIIHIPNQVYLNAKFEQEVFKRIENLLQLSQDELEILQEVTLAKFNEFKNLFLSRLIIAFLNSKLLNLNITNQERNLIREIIAKIQTEGSLKDLIKDLFEVLKNNDKFSDLHELVDSFIIELNQQKFVKEMILGDISFGINLDEKSFEFLERVFKLNEFFGFDLISLNWSHYLSGGEEAILNQLSEYYNSKKDFDKSNCIFVIDEGELYLHPKWQRFYFFSIIKILQHFTTKHNHLIITSHSPFIISDIPKENLFFLTKNEYFSEVQRDLLENTFGANIHSLFKDSFFLEGTFIGKYAEERIMNLIDKVKKRNDTYENLQREIDIIGEPFLKMKLTELNKKNKND